MATSPPTLLALLHRANQTATDAFAEASGDSELTPRQVQVLAAIEELEGGSQTNIVTATGIDHSTLADIIRRLSKRKLIERRRKKEDARAYEVKLSEAGQRELAKGKPVLKTVEKTLTAKLSTSERGDLVALLEKVIAATKPTAA